MYLHHRKICSRVQCANEILIAVFLNFPSLVKSHNMFNKHKTEVYFFSKQVFDLNSVHIPILEQNGAIIQPPNGPKFELNPFSSKIDRIKLRGKVFGKMQRTTIVSFITAWGKSLHDTSNDNSGKKLHRPTQHHPPTLLQKRLLCTLASFIDIIMHEYQRREKVAVKLTSQSSSKAKPPTLYPQNWVRK